MRYLDFLGTSIARDPRITFQYMLALDMSTTVRVIRNETGVFFFFPYFNKNETLLSPRSFDLFSECACDDEIEPLFKLGIQNAQSVFLI